VPGLKREKLKLTRELIRAGTIGSEPVNLEGVDIPTLCSASKDSWRSLSSGRADLGGEQKTLGGEQKTLRGEQKTDHDTLVLEETTSGEV